MIKSKEILQKSNLIENKAKDLSLEMSDFEYIITKDMLNLPLKSVWEALRISGFTKEQTDKIVDSIQKDLIGKNMHKGDNFHLLVRDSVTKAILNVVEEHK